MEKTVHEKLQALVRLQRIDTKLDKIRHLHGSLPEEVQDLEDELEGLKTRIQKIVDVIDENKKDISRRNITIKEQRDLLKKFDEQQMNVKNSREFDAIAKEIELAQLEILACEKKIKQINMILEERHKELEEAQAKLAERQKDLEDKKEELDKIIAETEKEEKEFEQESEKASEFIEDRLLYSYQRIRRNMRNGLAVVTVDRSACGGCFAVIPPQRLYEIRQKKKIIVCENCGRILVDVSYFEGDNSVN